MFFDARDDVVAETQTDCDMLAAAPAGLALASEPDAPAWNRRRRRPHPRSSPPADSPTTAALIRPEALPALSLVVPPDAEATDTSAMQRLRLQTPRPNDADADADAAAVTPTCYWPLAESNDSHDECVAETPTAASERPGKRPRSASPASSVGSASASAAALARKRALKASVWSALDDALDDTKEVAPSTAALDYDGDDEEQSPRVTSFVEYDAAELDQLDIAPSQDYFDGDGGDAAARESHRLPPQQTPCGFVDFQDLTQWNHESSEVFDDVIYAPRNPPPIAAPPLPTIQEQVHASPRDVRSPDPSSSIPPSVKQQECGGGKCADDAARDENESDSDASLSDGFDISRAIGCMSDAKAGKLQRKRRSRMQPPQCKQPVQWCERRSVKRDCSFIESASPKIHRARAVSRIEELKAVEYIDSSDDLEGEPTKFDMGDEDELTTLSGGSGPAAAATWSATSVFQPRLSKKRRKKARQLGLNSFFRSRPCV